MISGNEREVSEDFGTALLMFLNDWGGMRVL